MNDKPTMWSTLATAIAAVEALPYVEVPDSDPFDGEIVGHGIGPREATLHQMRLPLDLVKASFKRVSTDSRIAVEDSAERADAHDWHAMITWFSAIVAAGECFHLDESDPALDGLRSSFPRGRRTPTFWLFRWQSYYKENPREERLRELGEEAGYVLAKVTAGYCLFDLSDNTFDDARSGLDLDGVEKFLAEQAGR
jgi:hypothetical protein